MTDRQLRQIHADKDSMARPLRFVPPNTLVETTTRTLQGRLLLRPSPELNDLVLGIIGKAQNLYAMIIHAFVVASNHAHFLLSPESAHQLARFMQFVNTNIAKEAGRLHDWSECVLEVWMGYTNGPRTRGPRDTPRYAPFPTLRQRPDLVRGPCGGREPASRGVQHGVERFSDGKIPHSIA